jgi:hypothetical protein
VAPAEQDVLQVSVSCVPAARARRRGVGPLFPSGAVHALAAVIVSGLLDASWLRAGGTESASG